MSPSELVSWSTPHVAALDAHFETLFADAWPDSLGEACRYPLLSGGKRMRPLLCLAACESVGGDTGNAFGAAVALELLHTYSLVHDDLPAMDDDTERRGKPTVHVRFGEAAAILVGDALLTEAFATLAAGPDPARLVGELARAGGATGMIAGQAADIGMGGPIIDVEGLVRLHRGKTGALLKAALRMGGMCGGANPDQLAALTRCGEAVGLAFQIHDDLLDADQDADPSGPPNFVKLLGPDQTRIEAVRQARLAQDAAAGLPRAEVLLALARFAVDRTH